MLERCVLNSYLILLFSRKIPTFSYFLMKIPTFSYFFDLSYYLTPWICLRDFFTRNKVTVSSEVSGKSKFSIRSSNPGEWVNLGA